MEGILLKWTNYLSQYKERRFLLKGPILSYYIPSEEQIHFPKARMHLSVCTITDNYKEHDNNDNNDIDEDEKLKFEINTGSITYYLKARTLEEKKRWLNVLRQTKLESENFIRKQNVLKNNQNNNNFNNDILFEEKKKEYQIIKEKFLKDKNTLLFLNNLDKLFNINNNNINNNIIINNIFINDDHSLISNNSKKPSKLKNIKNVIKRQLSDKSKKSRSFILINNNEKFYECEQKSELEISNITDLTIINDDDFNENSFILKRNISNKNILLNNNINNNFINNKLNKNNFKYFDPLYTYKKRTSLPSICKKLNYNAWDFLKGAIGKDVNRFTVPIFFNEPLSMLEKLCENFQYADCLNKAAQDPNQFHRLAYCACFCLGGFTMNIFRAKKFFNPILHETYEYVDNTLGFRFYSEQVSHHPAITAIYAEGNGWNMYTNNNVCVKFLLTGGLKILNLAKCYVNFFNFNNEQIIYTKPIITVRNLIFGQITLDICDSFTVTNNNGDICEVQCIPYTSGQTGNIKGIIKNVNNDILYKIEGNWLNDIKLIDVNNKENEIILWKYIPSLNQENYYYQPMTFDLNNLTEEMKKYLPKTDSRFRKDQRLMEFQHIEEAATEKARLEEKQRKDRKEDEKKGIINKPLYFEETYDDISGELIYVYKGNYFDDRKNQNFQNLPDIFGN